MTATAADVLIARLAAIDADIVRLHQHAEAADTEEFAAILDVVQIDELLEQRHKLTCGAK